MRSCRSGANATLRLRVVRHTGRPGRRAAAARLELDDQHALRPVILALRALHLDRRQRVAILRRRDRQVDPAAARQHREPSSPGLLRALVRLRAELRADRCCACSRRCRLSLPASVRSPSPTGRSAVVTRCPDLVMERAPMARFALRSRSPRRHFDTCNPGCTSRLSEPISRCSLPPRSRAQSASAPQQIWSPDRWRIPRLGPGTDSVTQRVPWIDHVERRTCCRLCGIPPEDSRTAAAAMREQYWAIATRRTLDQSTAELADARRQTHQLLERRAPAGLPPV